MAGARVNSYRMWRHQHIVLKMFNDGSKRVSKTILFGLNLSTTSGHNCLYRAYSAWFPFAWHLGWLEWAQPTLAGLNQCQTVDHHHFPEKTLSSRTRLVLRFPPWLWSLAGVIWPAAANRSLKTLRSVWSSSWWAWLFYELCFLGWCLGWRFTAPTACSTAPRHE